MRIFVFLLPIMAVLYPADYFLSTYLSDSKDYAAGEVKVWKDIYDGHVNSELVIYGSSRAWIHFSPKIIEDSLQISAYNLGMDGHNFSLQYLRHKELLKFNKPPTEIILSLDVFTIQREKDLYNYEQFLPFLLWNKDIRQYTSSYIGFSMYDYDIPLVRYQNESNALLAAFKSLMDYHTTPARIKGYMGMDKYWNDDLENAQAKAGSFTIDIDSTVVQKLEQFINECKEYGIRLTLVFSPEYIEGQAFVRNRNEIISIYKNFAKKYNLLFLDYSNDTLSHQKQFFYNAEHLNKLGSELFTIKLINDFRAQQLDPN